MTGKTIAKQRRQARIAILSFAGLLLVAAAVMVFRALDENLLFFITPSDLETKEVAPGQAIRLGGLVKPGSVERSENEVSVRFAVTDAMDDFSGNSVWVTYAGILPDLFREGQGVIAEGAFGTDGTFVATNVLAKHDEKYMPPEVAEALKEKGLWVPDGEPAAGSAKDTSQ